MNLLRNGSFEGGWTRQTHSGIEYGEIFVPEGWTAFWQEGGVIPEDPTNKNGYGRPEMHVIKAEAPFLDPPRIYAGNQSLKFFTFYRAHKAGVYQKVTDLTPGQQVTGRGVAHAWSSVKDDPKKSSTDGDGATNFTFQLGIDPTGGTDPWSPSVIWGMGAHIYDHFSPIPELKATVQGDSATLFVKSTVKYPFKHCDAYIDDLVLDFVVIPPVVKDTFPVVAKGTKLYPHGIGNSGTEDACKHMVAEGSPFSYIKIVASKPKDLLSVREIKSFSPKSKIVARLLELDDNSFNLQGPDFSGDPQVYMDLMYPYFIAYPEVAYWELWNEQDPPNHLQMARYAVGCMQIAKEWGIKLAVMSYSTGVPETYEWQDIWAHTTFFQEMKLGEHILSLHAYCRSMYPAEFESHLLRPVWLYENILIPNNCVVPFLFTEYNVTEVGSTGIEDHPEFPTVDSLMAEYTKVDAVLSNLWYCLGATLYTFGQIDDTYRLDDLWFVICETLLKVKTRDNALPPALPDPEEKPGTLYHRRVILADPNYMSPAQLDEAYKMGRQKLVTVTPSWQDVVPDKDEWITNIAEVGPMPVADRQKYIDWVKARDENTELIFEELPQGFKQGDPEWALEPLGTSSYVMDSHGCLVTSVAEWMLQVDPTMDPGKLVRWLNANNGFTTGYDAGRLILSKPPAMTGGFKLKSYLTGPGHLPEILSLLHTGPVICQVDYNPKDPDIDSHFVLAIEYLEDSNDLLVVDPWYGETVSLMSLYGRGKLENSVFNVLVYELDSQTEPGTEPPTPEPPVVEADLPLLGFNDPNNVGAYNWLKTFKKPCLDVVPIFLTGGPTELHFDTSESVRVIVNLRYSWSTDKGGEGTLPLPGPAQNQFVDSCIKTILASTGVWAWTIGNEANNPREFPRNGSLTPSVVVSLYNKIRAGVRIVNPGVRMCPGALDPFNAAAGDVKVWLASIYDGIAGAELVTAHGYVRGPDSSLVISDAKFTDDPLKWQYLNYVGCVTELLKYLPEKYRYKPVYITEFNHIWKTSEAVGDLGWVINQNAAEVIAAGYGAALAKKFAGLALYRWSGDEWAVDSNTTVLGTVRRLIEEIQP